MTFLVFAHLRQKKLAPVRAAKNMIFFFFNFLACKIIALQPGIEPMLPALGTES